MSSKYSISSEKKELLANLVETYNIKTATDLQNALKDLMGETLQEMLESELDEELGYERYEKTSLPKTNYRNGHKPKTLKSSMGELEIGVPQDRNSAFEPRIVPKHKTSITDIEQKVINMYARGMTNREISEQIEDIYGFGTSAELVSRITDKIVPQIEEWQSRRLSDVYPIVFIDAIVFSVRKEKTVQKSAVYVVLGVDSDGIKDVLSIEIGETESAKFWLSVLNNLKNRGVKDILVLCADGLTGIKEAIAAAFPMTEYQRCIVHMVRNTLLHVAHKHKKEFANDLKTIYHAVNEENGHKNMLEVKDKWDKMYPNAMKRWVGNWDVICPIFKYSPAVRKALYTTNAIESLNSQYRRINAGRPVFPSEEALKKALFLVTQNITKKWTTKIKDWGQIFGELSVIFEDRL
ncbi:MAG: IS256 family transposase [Synergistaceae bacterium]|jgi:transposase-like protein|nr:IS256 family transposase [Synergistaceae bacterium]